MQLRIFVRFAARRELLLASRAGSCVDEVAGFVVVDVSPDVGSVVPANITARPPHQIVDLSVLF